jgi:hypothetical protein
MQAVAHMPRIPIRPFLVVLTILFALVLGLLAGYFVARVDGAPPSVPTHFSAQVSAQGPDAVERNQQLDSDQHSKDTTHGQ